MGRCELLREVEFPDELEVERYKWEGGERRRYEYDIKPEGLVWDVGGYEGKWSEGMMERYGCRVELFEVVPQYVKGLRVRFSGHSRKGRVVVHGFGLGARDGEVGEMRDVVGMLEGREGLEVAVMKVNIEGGEYVLLERVLDAFLIERFRNVQVQFHNFETDSVERRDGIRERLSRTHEESWCYPWVWESWVRKG